MGEENNLSANQSYPPFGVSANWSLGCSKIATFSPVEYSKVLLLLGAAQKMRNTNFKIFEPPLPLRSTS